MCKVRLLIIGESEWRNNKAASFVKDQCIIVGNDVRVVCKVVQPTSGSKFDTSEYDLAIVDEDVISKGCSREVLGSGLPILMFRDVTRDGGSKNETQMVISGAVTSAVERSRLREHICMTTEHIAATRKMMSRVAYA